MAKAMKAKKDMAMEALAMSVNLSLPQFAFQSSRRVAAEDDADIRRYARICSEIFRSVSHQSPHRNSCFYAHHV